MASHTFDEEPHNEGHRMSSVQPPIGNGDSETGLGASIEERPSYAWELAQAFNDASDDDAQLGVFHPVLIFGTSLSGKSLALASLLSYTQQDELSRIVHNLIDFTYPASHPARKDVKDWAEYFYYKEVTNFQQNPYAKAEPTRREHPFFLPIKTVFRLEDGRAEVARFAFLESVGEWLHPEADGYTFRELRPDIVEILENYSNPISVIFVAPATRDDLLDETKVKQSHHCVEHFMKRYVHHRKRNHRDNLLLLISRWDAKYRPDTSDASDSADEFARPTSSIVIGALDNYPWAWSTFSNLSADDVPRGSRALLQYAPTWIKDGKRTPEGRFHPIFNRFNRTVWNWLYGNVFIENDESGLAQQGERKNFYADVALGRRGRGIGLYAAVMKRAIALVGM